MNTITARNRPAHQASPPREVTTFLRLPIPGQATVQETRLTLASRQGKPTIRFGVWKAAPKSGRFRPLDRFVDLDLAELDGLILALRGIREDFEAGRG